MGVNYTRGEVRLLRARAPHLQLALNDEEAVAIPYLSACPKKEGPAMVAKAGGAPYRVLGAEFELLWKEAVPLEAEAARA